MSSGRFVLEESYREKKEGCLNECLRLFLNKGWPTMLGGVNLDAGSCSQACHQQPQWDYFFKETRCSSLFSLRSRMNPSGFGRSGWNHSGFVCWRFRDGFVFLDLAELSADGFNPRLEVNFRRDMLFQALRSRQKSFIGGSLPCCAPAQ